MRKKSLFSRKYTKSQRKNFLFVYLLIALPVVQFLIFWLYVHIDSIALAFMDDVTKAFTFDHFIEVWNGVIGTDVYGFNLLEMLGRSLCLWAVANVIAFPLGLASTYVLYRKVLGHYAFRVIYTIPTLVGAVIWVSLIRSCTDANGIIVYIIQKLGFTLDDAALNQGLLNSEATAFPTLIVLTFVTGMVGGNVIATGAYAKVPPELVEAGKIDGLGFWGTFFHIALPCAWPTISTLLTVSLCTIFVADGNVFLFSNSTGQPGMATMGYYLYYLTYRISNTSAANAPYGYPAALGICISVISVPVVLLGRKLLNKIVSAVQV